MESHRWPGGTRTDGEPEQGLPRAAWLDHAEGFDAEYYRRAHPEVRTLAAEPLTHYLNSGWIKCYNPSADFDTVFYRMVVSGLTHPELCPLVHYNNWGRAAGAPRRRAEALATGGYTPPVIDLIAALPELAEVFDARRYIDRYPDVLLGDLTPLEHYLVRGWREGRNPSESFDTAFYRETFMHNDAADICPLLHYLSYGREASLPTTAIEASRRTLALLGDQEADPSAALLDKLGSETVAVLTEPYFDTAYYLRTNNDVALEGISPYWHYINYGWPEGRNPNPFFDTAYYARKFMGGKKPAVNPLLHYAVLGRIARRPSAEVMSMALMERAIDSVFSDAVRHLLTQLGTSPGLMNLDRVRRFVLPLFSASTYRKERGLDPSISDVDAFLRYLLLDFPVGLPPGPMFSADHYMAETRRLGVTMPKPWEKPFHHWLKHGSETGISPNPGFSADDYLALNPDLTSYPESLFEHFIRHGQFEGRRFSLITTVAGKRLASLSGNHPSRPRDFCEAMGAAFGKEGSLASMRDFLASGRLEKTIREAAATEPDIGGLDRNILSLLAPWHDESWAEYREIIRILPEGQFDSIVLMPFCKLGGADFVAGVLTFTLQENGRVLVIRTDGNDWARPDWFPPDVATVDLSAHLNAMNQPTRIRALYALLVRLRPAAVYNVNSRLAFDTFVQYGERLALITRLYAYYFCADRTPEGIETGYPVWYFSNILPHLTGAIIDNATLSNQLIQRYSLTGGYRERVRVIYTPAMSAFPEVTVADAQAVGARRRGRKRVLWAGRLDVQKRFDLVQTIARRLTEVDFDCWGKAVLDTPPDLSALPPNLKLHPPFKSYQDLPLADSDGWLYTSAWDGLPTMLIELAAMGVPMVASAVGGVPELVDGTTGWPIDQDATADCYAEAILEMVCSPAERVLRGRALQARAISQHNRDNYRKCLAAMAAPVTKGG
jgi:glycosyltransferase involved in cell wall biosynthesis